LHLNGIHWHAHGAPSEVSVECQFFSGTGSILRIQPAFKNERFLAAKFFFDAICGLFVSVSKAVDECCAEVFENFLRGFVLSLFSGFYTPKI